MSLELNKINRYPEIQSIAGYNDLYDYLNTLQAQEIVCILPISINLQNSTGGEKNFSIFILVHFQEEKFIIGL